MRRTETIRKTFVQDPKLTPGIIGIVSKIAKNSLTSFRDRTEASKKYYDIFAKAKEQQDR